MYAYLKEHNYSSVAVDATKHSSGLWATVPLNLD